MIRITQLKLHPDEGNASLEALIRRTLRLGAGEAFSFDVLRRSVDARKKPDIYYVYTVLVKPGSHSREKEILKRCPHANVSEYRQVSYRFSGAFAGPMKKTEKTGSSENPMPEEAGRPGFFERPMKKERDRPVIIGTGPAGLFCSLLLSRAGLCPILIERGERAKERTKRVSAFWSGQSLDPDSNVQFGEGGAGTFSDGKLNTGVKDPEGRIRFVLETFVEAGADPSILISAMPHVGTDVLTKVVTNITDEIVERGAEVYFNTKMTECRYEENGWTVLCSQKASPEKMLTFQTGHLVLAIGHSSRDTFRMLKDTGIDMSAKAFAVGVRIQHPQSLIDLASYGADCPWKLPPSPYKLTHHLRDGRGVYTFCMCPGGYVVNASSGQGYLAVNGMSLHDRSSGVANSAVVVTVSPDEIADHLQIKDPDVLIGVRFQEKLERAAFLAGDGKIPAQRFEDFRKGEKEGTLPGFEPAFCGSWTIAGVRGLLPESIASGIEEGILSWDNRIKGFAHPDALLSACESRTSSPVRITRNEAYQSPGHPGLYPCGEGAGYAGGITSAAVDGLKVAEQILGNLE